MNNKLIFDALKRFDVYYKNKKFDFNLVEEQLISSFSFSEKESRIYVFPRDNDYLTIVNLIYSILKYSFDGIYKDGEDILDSVKVGNLVEYNKSLAEYRGVIDNRIVLKFRDGTDEIPLKWRYRISKYNGSATVLNKMPTKANVGTKKTKGLLSQMLDIEQDELCKINKKSILFVINKDRIFRIIRDLQIKVGDNEKVNISEIFPMGYYRSADNCYYFKGNAKKEDPLIKFASKVYVAKELVKKMKSISNVSIIANKIYVDDFSDLKYIFKRKTINNTSTFVSPIDIERFMNNDYINDGFKIRLIEINNSKFTTSSNLKERQYKYLDNYLKSNINYININEEVVSKFRRELNKECKKLLELFKYDNQILKFIVLVRSLCKRLTTLMIPISEYERIASYVNVEKSIKFMHKKILNEIENIKTRDLHKDLVKSIDMIYEYLDGIYTEVKKSNPKWNKLNELIRYKRNERVSIIIENAFIRKITRDYLKERYPNKHNISIDDGNNRSELYDEVVILGLLNENLYFNYNRYNATRVCILGYKFEKKYFDTCKKKFLRYLKDNLVINEENHIFDIDDTKKIIECNDNDLNYELELENEINSLITINQIPEINQGLNSILPVKCEKVILFTDSRKAFLTSQYKVYVLKENTEELQTKSIKQLNIGDILLFVEGIEKDIVENVIQGLMQVKEIYDVYNSDYELSKIWKKELKYYMDYNNLNYNDLQVRLANLNVDRDKATIRTWVVDEIVGPQEKEVYEAIAKVTNSSFLMENYEKIYNACNNIRSFQVKVRKLIAKFLLYGKKHKGLNQIDKLIIGNIDNKIDYINRVQIEKIYDVKKEVPSNLINRVLEV